MAHASLDASYSNLGENNLAAGNARKAHDLRVRVSEQERFYIESHYNKLVAGGLEYAKIQ
jgi:hypothetical protein